MFRLPRLPLVALSAVLASAFLFAGPADARKRGGFGEPHEPTESQKAVRALKHEIAVNELFHALALSPDQASTLAGLVADVVAEKEQRQSERAAQAPKVQAILATWLSEVQSDGQPSERTVAALKDLREANRPDREENKEARADIKARLTSILTEEQGEVLRSFRPLAAAAPSDEERQDRADRPDRRDRQDRADRPDRRDRQAARMTVRQLLFSAEMLDLLN